MNKSKLIEVLSIQSESYNQWRTFAYCVREAKRMGAMVQKDLEGNLYITKGESDVYPCLVAHMDTVHDIGEDLKVFEINGALTGFNRCTMTQTGIGGDDKVGIFIALQCLELFDNIKVAFFVNEEVGCVGSYEADVKWFNDCSFVLQCDRKGNKDFIVKAGSVPLSSKSFQDDILNTITSFGYKFGNGMMTDVMALKEIGLSCACANMSCGYYNPHEANEYVVLDDVENCLDMVKQIIVTCGGIIYPHLYEKEVYRIPSYDKDVWNRWGTTGDWASREEERKFLYELCEDCAAPTNNASGLCDACIKSYNAMYDLEDHDFPVRKKTPAQILKEWEKELAQPKKIIAWESERALSKHIHKNPTVVIQNNKKKKNKFQYFDKRNLY